MTRKNWFPALLIFGTALLISPPAHANVMVPLVVGGWVAGMVVLLIPIILIESAILMSIGAGVWRSLVAVLTANLASTLAGLPLAIMLEILVVGTTPLYEEDPDYEWSEWSLPIGGVLLCIPFFFLSWWIEAPIVGQLLDELPSQVVDVAVRNGNLVTYLIFALMIGGFFAWAILASADKIIAEREEREAFTEAGRLMNRVHPSPGRNAWRNANWHAKRGITRLRLAEFRIAKRAPIRDHKRAPSKWGRKYQMKPPAHLDARQTANWCAKRGMARLKLAEFRMTRRAAIDDQVDRRKVRADGQTSKTVEAGSVDVVDDGSAKTETVVPAQTEDTDLAA